MKSGSLLSVFIAPIIVTAIAVAGIGWWGGWQAFGTAILLVALEVTLSFDNAVVNARVLSQLSEKWQRRFLTWGIFFSVVVTRAFLPVIIVAISTGVSFIAIGRVALFEPALYAQLLGGAHAIISSFGGTFLTLVGLKYFLDQEKEVHWLQFVEKRLAQWGDIESVELGISLLVLFVVAMALPAERSTILLSGLTAVLIFILLNGLISALSSQTVKMHHTGIALFAYLNVLDAAFSLDSVVGAFALSTQLPVIIAGLGSGAYFVRSLTLYLVRNKVLDTLAYIEHGAHWAIIGLAGAMFANLFFHLPDPFTGLIGLILVSLAYVSSVRVRDTAR